MDTTVNKTEYQSKRNPTGKPFMKNILSLVIICEILDKGSLDDATNQILRRSGFKHFLI